MFFKKLISTSCEYVDIHSHILPGFDDGSKDLETTLKMAKSASSIGFKKIVVTPHYKKYIKSASPTKISEMVKRVNLILEENGIDVTLYPGNEIMTFEECAEYLNESKIKTMNDTNFVLVEFQPQDSFSKITNDISSVMTRGYNVILAHAERYDCLTRNYENLEQLKDMRVLIQANLDSVLSKDKSIKKFLAKALKNEYIDFLASDAHDTENRSYEVSKTIKYLYRKYNNNYVNDLLKANAVKYLNIEG